MPFFQDKKRAKEKKEKADKKAADEALRQLLNEGLENQHGKSKAAAKADAVALGVDSSNKMEAPDSDSDSDSDFEYDMEYINRSHGRTEVEMDPAQAQSEGVEVYHEVTIEDIIEAQRAKLAAEGKQGIMCLFLFCSMHCKEILYFNFFFCISET